MSRDVRWCDDKSELLEELRKAQLELGVIEKQVKVTPLSLPLKKRIEMLHLQKEVRKLQAYVDAYESESDDEDDESSMESDARSLASTKKKDSYARRKSKVGSGFFDKGRRSTNRRFGSLALQALHDDRVGFLRKVLTRCISSTMRTLTSSEGPVTQQDADKRLQTVSFDAQTRYNGEFLARENETQDTFWLIVDGRCAVLNSKMTRTCPVAYLEAGEFVGLTSVLSHGKERNSVVVVSPTASVFGLHRIGLPSEICSALAIMAERTNAWHEVRAKELRSPHDALREHVTQCGVDDRLLMQEQEMLEPFRLEQSAFLSGKAGENVGMILEHFRDYRCPEAKTISFSRTAEFFLGMQFGEENGVENVANVEFNTARQKIMDQKKARNVYLGGALVCKPSAKNPASGVTQRETAAHTSAATQLRRRLPALRAKTALEPRRTPKPLRRHL